MNARRFNRAARQLYPQFWLIIRGGITQSTKNKLGEVLAEIASYHARFKQGFEVAWALWITKLFSVVLPDSIWTSICSVDDSIVALLSLDLNQAGLADNIDATLWAQLMSLELCLPKMLSGANAFEISDIQESRN